MVQYAVLSRRRSCSNVVTFETPIPRYEVSLPNIPSCFVTGAHVLDWQVRCIRNPTERPGKTRWGAFACMDVHRKWKSDWAGETVKPRLGPGRVQHSCCCTSSREGATWQNWQLILEVFEGKLRCQWSVIWHKGSRSTQSPCGSVEFISSAFHSGQGTDTLVQEAGPLRRPKFSGRGVVKGVVTAFVAEQRTSCSVFGTRHYLSERRARRVNPWAIFAGRYPCRCVWQHGKYFEGSWDVSAEGWSHSRAKQCQRASCRWTTTSRPPEPRQDRAILPSTGIWHSGKGQLSTSRWNLPLFQHLRVVLVFIYWRSTDLCVTGPSSLRCDIFVETNCRYFLYSGNPPARYNGRKATALPFRYDSDHRTTKCLTR